MTEDKKPKRPRGRPPVADKADKTLSRVRVTQGQIEDYQRAAKRTNKTLSSWVKDTLDKASQ